jgi:SAM-dependent methyltransferase
MTTQKGNANFMGIINANPTQFLVQWILQQRLQEMVPRYVTGRLLDIGCGTKPYKNLLGQYVNEHVGIDLENTFRNESQIDICCSAYDIPLENESFDCAFSTAVLEHLEEPELALRECHRLLKRGGYAIYSVPFIWHLHEEPRDFYRFSKYGLKYIFEKVGFEIVELKPLSGFWVTFGQLFVYYMYRFNRGPLRWLKIIALLGIVVQLVAYILDRIDKAEQWTWMHVVVARKK